MNAWYKPHHEPDRASIREENTPEGYSAALRRIDTHDLKLLRDFWWKEVEALAHSGSLPQDLELAQSKLQRLNTEIAARNGTP